MSQVGERLPVVPRIVLIAACVGALMVLKDSDTEGSENPFQVEGTIVSVGERSVGVGSVDVIDAEGKAEGWFKGNHTIHDNYRTCDWGRLATKEVGEVYSSQGEATELEDVEPGDRVALHGRIRDSYSKCGKRSRHDARPVFDALTVMNNAPHNSAG